VTATFEGPTSPPRGAGGASGSGAGGAETAGDPPVVVEPETFTLEPQVHIQ
jgi:hypothetical protein